MGALTSKPVSFSYRKWEFTSLMVWDLTDTLTPRIRVDVVGSKIRRILPLDEWITNKSRFLFKGLMFSRSALPVMCLKQNYDFSVFLNIWKYHRNSFLYENFSMAFSFLKRRIKLHKAISFILGGVYGIPLDYWSIIKNPSLEINFQSELPFSYSRSNYDFLDSFSPPEKVLFLNTNPRLESPAFQVKIRDESSNFYSLGFYNYDFPTIYLGNSTADWNKILGGKYLTLEENDLILSSLGSLSWPKMKEKLHQFTLLPPWLNNLNHQSLFQNFLPHFSSLPIHLAPQAVISRTEDLSIVFSSHLENPIHHPSLFFPFAGILESSQSFFSLEGQLLTYRFINPSFTLSDFLASFFITLVKLKKKKYHVQKKIWTYLLTPRKAFCPSFLLSRVYFPHSLFTLPIPNIYLRDPLSRANRLFQEIDV